MIPTVLALVEAGIGAAIVPANLGRARADTLVYLPLADCGGIDAELLLARAPDEANAMVDNFLRIMRSWGAENAQRHAEPVERKAGSASSHGTQG